MNRLEFEKAVEGKRFESLIDEIFMRKVNKIIVHCSDSDIKKHDDIAVIREWHTQKGFIGPDGVAGTNDDVGYHYFIKFNGEIQRGRLLESIGAHCKGHNKDSIGICLHGRENFTTEQFASLKRLINVLKQQYEKLTVYGHRDFDKNKTCPNFDVHALMFVKDEKHV